MYYYYDEDTSDRGNCYPIERRQNNNTRSSKNREVNVKKRRRFISIVHNGTDCCDCMWWSWFGWHDKYERDPLLSDSHEVKPPHLTLRVNKRPVSSYSSFWTKTIMSDVDVKTRTAESIQLMKVAEVVGSFNLKIGDVGYETVGWWNNHFKVLILIMFTIAPGTRNIVRVRHCWTRDPNNITKQAGFPGRCMHRRTSPKHTDGRFGGCWYVSRKQVFCEGDYTRKRSLEKLRKGWQHYQTIRTSRHVSRNKKCYSIQYEELQNVHINWYTCDGL